MNRFKGLDLVSSVPEQLWTEVHNIVQEAANKTIPKKKKSKKAKWLSEETLQIAEERREVKSKGERERYIQLNSEFQKIPRRDKKGFFNEQCLIIETKNNNIRGKTRDLFRKTGNIKGAFCPKMGTIVDKNGKRPSRCGKDQEEMERIHGRTVQKRSQRTRLLQWCG